MIFEMNVTNLLEPPKETIFSSALAEKSAGVSLDLSLSPSSSPEPTALALQAMATSGFNSYIQDHDRHDRFDYKDFREGIGESTFSYSGMRLNKQYSRAKGINSEAQSRSRNSSATFSKSFVELSPYFEELCESSIFSCNFCGRKFHNAQALGGHQNAHKHERDYARISHQIGAALRERSSSTDVYSTAFSDKPMSQTGPGYSLVEKTGSAASGPRQCRVGQYWTANPNIYSSHYNHGLNYQTISELKAGVASNEDVSFHWPGNRSAEESSGNAGLILKGIHSNEDHISVLDLSLRL